MIRHGVEVVCLRWAGTSPGMSMASDVEDGDERKKRLAQVDGERNKAFGGGNMNGGTATTVLASELLVTV